MSPLHSFVQNFTSFSLRDYIVIANTMCVLIIPTAIMLASTFLLLRQMLASPTSLTFTSEQERNRKKRNRSITIMLIGE